VRVTGDIQLHYRFARAQTPSKAPPLICLHCSPVSSRIYDAFLGPMSQDRTVVAIDTPGYGGSDPLTGTASIAGYASAIGEAVEQLVDGPVDLFGYHTGSAVALELGRAQPTAIRRIVMNSALLFGQAEHDSLGMLKARGAMTIAERADELPAYWRFFRDWWRDVPDDETTWPLFLDSVLRASGQMDGFFAAFDYDFEAALRATTHPFLLLNPSDDLHEATLRAGPFLGDHGRMHLLPGWTHGFLHLHAEETAALLRDFLSA
jgi:pimeloyl-ACP methyl ester carboxylesterase